MVNVKFAGLAIGIDNKYPYLERLCTDYIIEEEDTDFSVSVSEAEIDRENDGGNYDRGYLESLAVYRKIADKLPEYNAFLMHGSVIDVDGIGTAFLAVSGTGKTTHTSLWIKLLGERCRIVNGDKPIVRIIDGRVYAYGTPYAGKEGYNINTVTELKNVFFIERSTENHVGKTEDIVGRLMKQIYINTKNPLHTALTLELTDSFSKLCKFNTIHCNMDISAAELAYNTSVAQWK